MIGVNKEVIGCYVRDSMVKGDAICILMYFVFKKSIKQGWRKSAVKA
jgi:hypothetical protein